jgi:CO/xanthine dehydrogenase Mo-binding subunit
MLTVFRQLLAEELGLPLAQVRIDQTTEGIEFDRGVGGSRITRMIGRVISLLAERAKARLAALVAAEFGYETEQISVEPGGFRTPEGGLLNVSEAAALAPNGIAESLQYQGGPADVVEIYAAIAAEVAVDAETGEVQLRRVVNAQEVGRVVDRLMHQGQIDGGLTQGLGYALMEGLNLDEGKVAMANLHEYKLPTAADVPVLETILLPPDLSLGITPIGEGPNAAMSACVVNAVADVLGRQVDIPVAPEALV